MSKPAIVLVHGYRGSPAGLAELGEHLQRAGYDIYLPDVPPFGNAQPLRAYDRDSYADYLKTYLETQNLKHPVLIGHSMGSLVVAATAEKYPELLDDKLVFLAPISAKPPRPITILNPLVTTFPRGFVDVTTTAFNMVPSDLDTMKKTLHLTRESSKNFASKTDVKLAGDFSIQNSLADFNFKKSALFLAGAKDHLISRKHTASLAQKLNQPAVFIPGTGHLLNYEKPAETASAILSFLESAII